ncbi:MAG: hypothetical protein JSR45_06510 [Proteobacteria bacterium]|nr:hypothetical protein [Pseudomonadota bacterium]
MNRVGRHGWQRRGALALACLAFALRALVASGYMLAPRGPGGAPTIQICTAQGMIAIPDPAVSKDAAPRQSSGKSAPAKSDPHPCPYAATAAALSAPNAFATAAPFAIASADRLPAAVPDQRPGLGLAAPPPQPTGPPAIV